MKFTSHYMMASVLALCGCSSSSKEEARRTAELAEQLVTCKNEQSAAREKLELAQAELRKRASCEGGEGPVGSKGPAAHRAGRLPPRAASRAAPAAPHPVEHRASGPANPEAEARTAQAVAQALRAASSQLKPCYERGLKRNVDLQFVTQVKVLLTVTPDGHLRDVHLSPRTEPDMEACISKIITRLSFPPYKGHPVAVEVPVSLRVQG